MERTVTINGKPVKLKASAMNLLIYQSEFNEDIFKAKAEFLKATDGDRVDLTKVNAVALAKMVWTLAKTADNTLPDFNTWLESLDELPVVELYTTNYELFLTNMFEQSDIVGSEPKNAPSTEESDR